MKCIKLVYGQKRCNHCAGNCVKNGKLSGRQQYRCKSCGKSFLSSYSYRAYQNEINESIQEHLKEGCGIRSIARLLKIAAGTVLARLLQIAKNIKKPIISLGKEYELDELRTYVKRKTRLYWVVYAIDRNTKKVIDFAVGRRTNKTLKRVTDILLLAEAQKVYTDNLPNYAWLLPSGIHSTRKGSTNHIERMNLTLRTHLKRLARRTLCFSRSPTVLTACLRIYFWG